MQAAFTSSTGVATHAARTLRAARRCTSSPTTMVLKRSVNARCSIPMTTTATKAKKKPCTFSPKPAGSKNQNSTLALESLAALRSNAQKIATEQNTLSWEQIKIIMLSSAVPMVRFIL